MKLKNFLRSFIFLIPLILVFSKSMPEPTFVQSKSIETHTQELGPTLKVFKTKVPLINSMFFDKIELV